MSSTTDASFDCSLSSLILEEEDLDIMARNDFDKTVRRREKILQELEYVEQELKKAREGLTKRGLVSILLIDDDTLRHVLSFCEYNELFEIDQTCKRFQKLAPWEKYDNDVPDAFRWAEKGSPSTSRSRKIRYERAASFASRIEPLVAAHTAHMDYEDRPGCEGCNNFPGKSNYDCFKPGKQNDYALFVRMFEERGPRRRTCNCKPSINNLLWQGFVDTYDCQPADTDEEYSWIGFKTQESFDRRKAFPIYDSAVDWRNSFINEVARIVPSDDSMRNAGFIVIAMHLIDKSMSLVYATSKLQAVDSEGNIFFGMFTPNECHPGFDIDDEIAEVEAEIRANPSDNGLQFCLTLMWPQLALEEG
mmetsp:Transcript_11130/g.17072  ORF Transcript_11130/g.17072 Transcript_11130/m.17072 type:complete len:362 (-) Transcript_11130:101-1186(-)